MTDGDGLHAAFRARAGALALDVDLAVAAGTTVAVLGPNGAGKTTLLRVLAGLHRIDAGDVRFGGRSIASVPADRRSVGFVFQDHVLFPHLSLVENVAFGLRARGTARRAAREAAAVWLARVGLAGRDDERPRALSGGEAQRVALARALAVEPRLLLLDEPMAALDATTRLATRRDLAALLAAHDGIRILVTHDPLEAMALGDRLVVLEEGRIVQEGTPAELTARPRSPYVADLVGVNLLRGQGTGGPVLRVDGGIDLTGAGAAPAGPLFAVVHPRAVALHRERPGDGSPRNVWAGEAVSVDLEGERARVRVRLGAGGPVLVAEVTAPAALALRLAEGGPVWASVKATEVAVYPR